MKMKILVFDNYDSFTYNLVHYIEKITHCQVDVFLNDALPLEKVKDYDKIILSPGPGIPVEAGSLLPLLKEYATCKSILGVCLGHQAIAENFGATLVNLEQVYHGVSTPIHIIKNDLIFDGLSSPFEAGRYHSWIVSEANFPDELEITARDENNYIMALAHKTFDIKGVQFHPESVLTPNGEQLLKNWLQS